MTASSDDTRSAPRGDRRKPAELRGTATAASSDETRSAPRSDRRKPARASHYMIAPAAPGVTGQALAANLAAHYPRPLVIFLVALLVVANTINITADIAAMGEALQMAGRRRPARARAAVRAADRLSAGVSALHATGRGLQVADARAARLRGRAVLCERRLASC